MRRREFLGALIGATVAWPPGLRAEDSPKIALVGHLAAGTEAARRAMSAAFLAAMRELGHTEDRDFKFVSRYANGDLSRLPALAKELLGLGPDVLLVETTPGNLAAKAATTTVPIVMVSVADPIGVGLVAGLAKPGGNVTGVTNMIGELAGKRL